jgi:hypothetical protein
MWVCPRIKFHMSSPNLSLVIAIEMKAGNNLYVHVMLSSCLHRNDLNTISYFSKMCYLTAFQDPKVNGFSVAPTSNFSRPLCYY